MKKIEQALRENEIVSDYKINIAKKESFELFFVKGKLETVRCTDTCDKEVTVYCAHSDFLGDAQFLIYPSTTDDELKALIEETANKALLIDNPPYTLPEAEIGSFQVESNFREYTMDELAALVAKTVFAANTTENGSLNSVEVFINRHTQQVINSKGLNKTQVRYTAMMEAIPTYNGAEQSVELYQQYNFSHFRPDDLAKEVGIMMNAAKARYEAIKPDFTMECKVILQHQEVAQLLGDIAGNLNYSSIYTHTGVYQKGDSIQKDPTADLLNITMCGQAAGCVDSSLFDGDGLALDSINIIQDGKAVNYYGSNRYGQYLGEKPTGNLRCLCAAAGSAGSDDFSSGSYLEVISMSGLQVDFFTDYIGGEVRLAYYCDGEKRIPVTGISISGQVSEVLRTIRLSDTICVHDNYQGPDRAILANMKIY